MSAGAGDRWPAVFIGRDLHERGDWCWRDLANATAAALMAAGYDPRHASWVRLAIIRARDERAAEAIATEWAAVFVGSGPHDPDLTPLRDWEKERGRR